MGFLSGVLSNIKEHLGQHKDTITPVIRLLEQNKHAGKNGFNDAIVKVVAGVRGYNEKVRESNERINELIKPLIYNITTIRSQSSGLSNYLHLEKINKHIDDCLWQAQVFAEGMERADKDVKDLQNALNNRASNANRIIKYQAERLRDIHTRQKDYLGEHTEFIGREIKLAQNLIQRKTRADIENFIREINARIATRQNEIALTARKLTQLISQMEQWIKKADTAVKTALLKIDAIIEEAVGNTNTKNKLNVENAVNELQNKALALHRAYETASNALPPLVRVVKAAVVDMDGQIQKDLQKLKKEVRADIEEYIESVRGQFDELKQKTLKIEHGGSSDSIMPNWEMLKDVVKRLVKYINGGENAAAYGGLEGIKKKITEYANGFGSNKFGTKVEEWVNELLKKDGGVNWWFDKYLNGSESQKFKPPYKDTDIDIISKQNIAIIAGVFKSRLNEQIRESESSFSSVKDGSSIDDKLTSVQDVCKKFADALEEKLQQGSEIVEKFIGEIAGDIDGLINSSTTSPISGNKSYLESAVGAILPALATMARQAANELKSLTSTSDPSSGVIIYKFGSNVEEAIRKVDLIGAHVNGIKDHFGKKITDALDVVRSNISELDNILTTHVIGGEIEETMMEYMGARLRDKMSDYGVHVESRLTNAINDVSTKALEPIKNAITVCHASESHIRSKHMEATKYLDSFRTSILSAASEGGDSARALLTELQKWISKDRDNVPNSLKKLKDEISKLQNDQLIPLVRKGQTIIADATGYSKKLLLQLEHHVEQILQTACSAIKQNMQSQYVQFFKSQLESFSSTVTDELNDIPEKVTSDATECFKGSMLLLHENLTQYMDVSSTEDYTLKTFALYAQTFFHGLLDSLNNDKNIMPKPTKIPDLYLSLNTLLSDLSTFNRPFCSNLSSLLDSIRPASYAVDSNPLLECLRSGVQRMCDELDKAYVSVYDGETFGANLVEKDKLTPYGTQLSKVFMSILEMYNEDLKYLKNRTIHKWSTSKIYAGSSLGTFLQNSGYGVSNNETEQNGHLDKNVRGEKIMNLLVGENYGHVYHKNKDYKFQLENLYDCLTTYYRIRHISTAGSKKSPCNVYEMLCWLTSLRYSSVYSDFISDDFSDLFDKRETKNAETNDPDFIPVDDLGELSLKACPQRITYSEIHDAIVHVTAVSSTVLTTIVGYGDAYGTYAVDFYSNALRLSYPSSSVDCLNMLIEVLGRLLPVFTFLHGQCSITAKHYGWSNCLYGKGIKWSTSPCDEHSKTALECHAKSPLQSFLRDCLPGYLPHQVESVGCKSDCKTCPESLPGAPCITPLGFRGFSGSTKTGKDLCNVLTKFMGNGVASPLFSLTPKPPKTLAEHFGFALSLVRNWKRERSYSLKTKMVSTIKAVSIGLCKNADNLTNALSNAYGDNKVGHEGNGHRDGTEADLVSLSTIESCVYPNKNVHCAPYLQSLYSNSYMYVAEKHANAYLSWALYLPWNLHSLLKSLLDAFSNIVCQDWGCSRCAHGSACRRGNHGVDYNCQCRGIIECRGVQSTLYSFGFMFGNSEKLAANESKRYCHNFYKQLRNVLNSQYFTKLFEECDYFIWTIREPFTYLVLALWSLSLFYLICVMVGRLDVLHIRSHLRSPSSHKITAQSLLAAAQVGRLAKISYLQP